MQTFIIEHLEPRLYPWCELEYRHISSIVGKNNLLFTNIRSASAAAKLQKIGRVEKKSVSELLLKKACLLDPEADKLLTPADGKKFDFFVFGGILGDDPPKERTKELLTSKMPEVETRNLGPKQMSTDTAVLVTKKIIDGTQLGKIKFIDGAIVQIQEGEEVILPYRYVKQDGKPFLAPGIETLLRKRKQF